MNGTSFPDPVRSQPAHHTLLGGWPVGPSLALRVPVVQAPLGRVSANPFLCAEVSRAGGLGCLTAHAPELASFTRVLARIRLQTPRPVLVAFTADWENDTLLHACFDLGFSHFYTFWWNGPRLAPRIRRTGGTVFWQVGSVREAQDAINGGADVLVLQGSGAGGQVRTPLPLHELMGSVRAEFPHVPLVAGGGLGDRNDVSEVLSWGASAALLGTRFLLSNEAGAEPANKARLLRAGEADLFLDAKPVGDWPCAPRRRLRLPTREQDVPGLYAGTGVGKMHTVLPAREIVGNLMPRSFAGYNKDGLPSRP